MSSNKYAQEQIARIGGGQEFLAKLSQGYQPNEAEIFQYFPPSAQEAAFEKSIADKVNITTQQIEPTTAKPFSGERLIERVAQKYFGGDYSQVDGRATDVLSMQALKTYGENALLSYKQNFKGC